jgi:hypothetical protein
MDTSTATKTEDDLYAQFKALQRMEEFLDLQEEYVKDEMKNLKRELIRAKEVSLSNCFALSPHFNFYPSSIFHLLCCLKFCDSSLSISSSLFNSLAVSVSVLSLDFPNISHSTGVEAYSISPSDYRSIQRDD